MKIMDIFKIKLYNMETCDQPESIFTCYVYLTVITSSPDPTPERDAVLQAGLSALLRAKDTPAQAPMV